MSDLGCLVTVIWTNISLTPAFITADLPFDVLEVLYLTAGMGHLTFTRVSSWITAIVTLERCLCVIAPLQMRFAQFTFLHSIINLELKSRAAKGNNCIFKNHIFIILLHK